MSYAFCVTLSFDCYGKPAAQPVTIHAGTGKCFWPVVNRWTLLPRIFCCSCSRGNWWWLYQCGTDSVRHFTRSCPYYRCVCCRDRVAFYRWVYKAKLCVLLLLFYWARKYWLFLDTTRVQFKSSKDIELPVRKKMDILSFSYSIPQSFFLQRVRYKAFMNCFMTIHETLTRKGHATMRHVRREAKVISHNLSKLCFVA